MTDQTKKILLVNGPNLNLLGSREPEKYGRQTLESIEQGLREYFQGKNMNLVCFQSNHEGKIIDFLQETGADYLIINPGALTHTSVALRDVLAAVGVPFIEVHISNIYAREEFRRHSFLSSLADGIITGCGPQGYRLAAEVVFKRLSSSWQTTDIETFSADGGDDGTSVK